MVALETSYLRMYWTDLQQIFKLGTLMGGYDHYDVLFAIAKGRCYGDQFCGLIWRKWHTPASFCALAFHEGWEDRNTDARVNTADDLCTSGKNVLNFS